MFRVPKNEPGRAERFYQEEYRQGFTSDCPMPDQLDSLIRTRFSGTPKDYTGYIRFLTAAHVHPGSMVYDFGCSWGYGSWQLQQAGYEVASYEISVPRASYARQFLGCRMMSPGELDHATDCLFSAHVIEHMDNPRELWRIADAVLKPNGRVVLFFPNGSLERAGVHSTWGQVHPLLLDSRAVQGMAQASGFSALTYASPFDLIEVAAGVQGTTLTGDELAVVAVRQAAGSGIPPLMATNS
jgi:SAM-dependent methyltransferase